MYGGFYLLYLSLHQARLSASAMSNDSQSSGEEEEISPLQYARQNGLSCDHLKEPMPRSCATIIEGIADGVTDDSHLNQFEFAEYNTDERLPLSKDAAILIAWATTPEKEELIRSIVQILLDSTQPKARYLELPVLMSDHETDCRQFARREGFEIKLADIRLPLELVDDEKGEGIIIPTKLWSHGTEIMEELKNEKISVTKETMTYLTNGLKLDWDRDVETEVRASIHKYQKVSIGDSYGILSFSLQTLILSLLEPCTRTCNTTSLAIASTDRTIRTFFL